jgi:hypothetical protein
VHYIKDLHTYMKNTVLLFAFLIFAQGCTSINQPTASIALVNNQFVMPSATVGASLADALANSSVGTVLAVQDQAVVMGNKFFAAIGFTCRKLTLEQSGQDIYCLNELGDWFKVNKVISEYNENDMQEAG